MSYRDDDRNHGGGDDYNSAGEDMEEDQEDVPQQVADLADASVPNSLKGVRACKRCGILKTFDQFFNDGCENCPFLDMVRC